MKITHNKIGQTLNLVDTAKADKANDAKDLKDMSKITGSGNPLDNMDAAKVEVSAKAQEAKRIKDLAMATPDVDMEKVERFRRMIDAGQYKVDAKAVADRMVDDHLETKN